MANPTENSALTQAPSVKTDAVQSDHPRIAERDSAAKVVGLVGLYDDVDSLVKAAERVRDAGYQNWDCHTPYPVHGLDQAMGLKPSPIPYVTLSMGFVGLAIAIALTGGLSVFQYPILVGGKALFSWQAFVPIFFELSLRVFLSCSACISRLRRFSSSFRKASRGVFMPRLRSAPSTSSRCSRT